MILSNLKILSKKNSKQLRVWGNNWRFQWYSFIYFYRLTQTLIKNTQKDKSTAKALRELVEKIINEMRPSSWAKEDVDLESFNVSQISDLVKSRLEAYSKDVKDMKSKHIEKQGKLYPDNFDNLIY